jgi:hypothetical protein
MDPMAMMNDMMSMFGGAGKTNPRPAPVSRSRTPAPPKAVPKSVAKPKVVAKPAPKPAPKAIHKVAPEPVMDQPDLTVTPSTTSTPKRESSPVPAATNNMQPLQLKKKKKKKKGFKKVTALNLPPGMGKWVSAIQAPVQQIEAMMTAEDQIDMEDYEAQQQQHSLRF